MMKLRPLAAAGLFLASLSVLAAPPLPPKMEGQRHTNGGRTNKVEAELVRMDGTDKAVLNTVYWDGCTRRGESTAEFKDGAWRFIIPGAPKCADVAVTVRPVEGKNRLEGEFKTDQWDGRIWYEW